MNLAVIQPYIGTEYMTFIQNKTVQDLLKNVDTFKAQTFITIKEF